MTGADSASSTPYRGVMRFIAGAILALGLSAAAVVFVTSPADEESSGRVQLTTAENSRKYQLELRRIGGKAAVAAAQFDEWFDSLWHGRRLAGTLAIISIAGALICLAAGRLPPPKPLK